MRRTIEGLFMSPRARRFTLRALLSVAALLCLSAAALALPRTYVSAAGNDARTCDRLDPCRTFAGAYSKTDVSGEIVALDAGEYGALTISKSIRVIAEGVNAGIQSATHAVTINGASTDIVVLHGLTLVGKNGLGTIHGINYVAGGVLHVENCVISRFSGRAISFGGAGQLYVNDTVLRDNASYGIYFNAGSGTAKASIDHCRMEWNNAGVAVAANATVTVRDSVAVGNTTHGFYMTQSSSQLSIESCAATQNSGSGVMVFGGKVNISRSVLTHNTSYGFGATGSSSKVSIEDCIVANNNTGIYVGSAATALVSNTTVTGNSLGLYNNPSAPGVLSSFGNNRVSRNTTDKTGPVTVTPLS